MENLISLKGICKTYGKGDGLVTALRPIDLDIKKGFFTEKCGMEKEIIVTITKANSFNYFDFIVETFKLAGTDWERCMGNQTGKPFFFEFGEFDKSRDTA